MKSNPQQTAIYFSILALISFVLSRIFSPERLELPIAQGQVLIISCQTMAIVIGVLNAFAALLYASMAVLKLPLNSILNKVYIRITLWGSLTTMALLGYDRITPFVTNHWTDLMFPLLTFILSAQVLIFFNFIMGMVKKAKFDFQKRQKTEA